MGTAPKSPSHDCVKSLSTFQKLWLGIHWGSWRKSHLWSWSSGFFVYNYLGRGTLPKLVQIKKMVFINPQVKCFRRLRSKGKWRNVLPRSVLALSYLGTHGISEVIQSRLLPPSPCRGHSVRSKMERSLVPRTALPTASWKLLLQLQILCSWFCPGCHLQ